MKKLPVDFFSFTEIGGVGEMIYKAVRFPEYVVEWTEEGEQVVVPLFSGAIPPEGGTDYALTGQDLLVSLCNLYQKINAPDSTVVIADAVRDWCKANIHPYNIDLLCEELEGDRYAHIKMMDIIRSDGTFEIDRFLNDLCNLGAAFELSFALDAAIHQNNPRYARALYYEGRVHDSLPFLEKYRVYEADKDYLAQIKADRKERVLQLLDLFPDFRMRLKFNPRYGKVEYGADVHSVFDICWYTFARMIADTAPPVDYGAEDMFAQGSVLSCMACGSYFVRRSSRQRYCQRPECQAERNRKNRRASYARHKDD